MTSVLWRLMLVNVALLAVLTFLMTNHAGGAVEFMSKIQPGMATLVGSVVGLCAIAWQTNRGFRNLIRSQEHRATIEREARDHSHALEMERKDRDFERERKALGAALHGELLALQPLVSESAFAWAAFGKLYRKGHEQGSREQVRLTFSSFEAIVFEKNVERLGMLGPSIAGDVVKVFGRARKMGSATTIDPVSLETAAMMCEGHAEMLREWSREIVYLAQRLVALQSGSQDPGAIFFRKQAKEAEQKPV